MKEINNSGINPDRQDKFFQIIEDEGAAQLCRNIEDEILSICEPYNNPDTSYRNMWLISPNFSQITSDRFATIQSQARALISVYDFANDYFGLPFKRHNQSSIEKLPTYLRLDAMSLREPFNSVISSEADSIPVGEGEVTAMHSVYSRLVGSGGNMLLPGSGNTLVSLLKDSFKSDRVRIVVPPVRNRYIGDYIYVSQFCQEAGLDVQVEKPEDIHMESGKLVGKFGPIEVVYRGFQLSHLYDDAFPNRAELLTSIAKENVVCYPPITFWDNKALIVHLFDPAVRRDLTAQLGQSTADIFYSMFPESWNCDPEVQPTFDGEKTNWEWFMSPEARKQGFVLKLSVGREAKGLVFSRKISNIQWHQILDQALKAKPYQYVLQRDCDDLTERFRVSYYDRETNRIITAGGWRDRLCVNIFITPQENGQRNFIVGNLDHTFRRGTRLVHSASDAVHVPVSIRP